MGAYTIGVCNFDEMKLKHEEAINFGFSLFKLKLDGRADEDVIRNFRRLTDSRYAVDVNQGWHSAPEAIRKIEWLAGENCFIVEQPLPKELNNEMSALKHNSRLPLFADESCQTTDDLEPLRKSFDGVNIKLMKCGGISGAVKMIRKARELDYKIIIGCMSESSVGCTAAAQLSPFAELC